MGWLQRTRDAYWLLFFLSIGVSVQAVTIEVNFPQGTLFSPTADAQAKGAINAAAADISAAITTSLAAISTDMYTGVNGSATVTLDWHADYEDRDTGAVIPGVTEVPSATLATDAIRIFFGTSSISGSTLGVGGPHIGVAAQISYFDPIDWPGAAADAAAQSEAAYTRGGGPIVGTLAGGGSVGGVNGSYSVDYGAAFGTVWLDVDADNDGNAESAPELDDYWHWNHTTSVAAGKRDLYSVAAHEILHAIGMGSSTSWVQLTNGTTWNGAEVQAITGSGANLVNGGGQHIANSVMSTRISDGSIQEVAMDPTLAVGTRKELTVLDLAFLRDIGYDTIAVSFPPDYDGDLDVDGNDLAFLESWFGINGSADADGDGDTDGADLLVWQRQYTGALVGSAVTTVPEPSSTALLLGLLGFAYSFGNRSRFI